MQKDEFIYWVNWLKVRWPNAKLNEYTIKSLYDDFKIYDDQVFGKVLLDYFDSGNEFLDWSKIKKLCKEFQIQSFREQTQLLAEQKQLESTKADPPSSLQAYLKQLGYKTFAEAVFYKSKELYKYNKFRQWQKDLFEPYKDLSYDEAQEKGWRLGLGLAIDDRRY